MPYANHKDQVGDDLHQPFKFGIDTAKAAVPAVNDWYFATDTGILYRCRVGGTWEPETYLLGSKQVDETDLADGRFLRYDSVSGKIIYDDIVVDSCESVVKTITQAHTFIVGDVVRLSGGSFVKAQADSLTNANAVGIVSDVPDAGHFEITTGGFISGLAGLTPGYMHYLDAVTAGALNVSAPATKGQYVKPMLIALTTTTGFVVNQNSTPIEEDRYTRTFTNTDLAAGILAVTHNLAKQFVAAVSIYNASNEQVLPDKITCTGINTLEIDLTSKAPLTGTYNLTVRK